MPRVAADRKFELQSGQTWCYAIVKCCFSAIRRECKDWLARNQDNMSNWSDRSIRGLLFQWASAMTKILLHAYCSLSELALSPLGLLLQWTSAIKIILSPCGLLLQWACAMKIILSPYTLFFQWASAIQIILSPRGLLFQWASGIQIILSPYILLCRWASIVCMRNVASVS